MHDFSSVRLATDRLDLRPLNAGDAAHLFAIFSDPEFMRYWSTPPWTSIDQATQQIAKDQHGLAAGEHLRLAIVRRDHDMLIGTCSLFKLDVQCRRAEIGYGIAPACWRQGYVTEAVGALLRFAFVTLELNRLEADVDPRNEGSARSLERLGFVREGLLRERWIVAGEVSDSAIYGLLRREFAQ